MTLDRKGFTLVELIVVSVLGAFVLGAIYQVLITNQRTYTMQGAVIESQQSTRMALELLFHDLRELSPGGGDIIAMSANQLSVRLMRKFGMVCETDVFVVTPTLKVLNHTGDRFEGGDPVFLFADNNDRTPNDDVWIVDTISAVDTTETCLGGRPATELVFAGSQSLFAADTVRVGATVRSVDRIQLRVDTWGGNEYLTRRVNDEATAWPIAGPLAPTNGLQFIYRDAMGNVTATPTDVRQIEVRVRAAPGVLNPLSGQVSDSLATWIHTRN